jgi:DNA-binding NtrC family response regulator
MGLIAHGGRLEGDDVDLADRVFRTDGATWVLEEERGSGLSSASPLPSSSSTAVQVAPAPERPAVSGTTAVVRFPSPSDPPVQDAEEVDEVLSLSDSERDLIRRALRKHGNRRRNAAAELGISERTLYRKIKEFGLA